jgi:glycosyltransferase involved in cell wall biosynthesis
VTQARRPKLLYLVTEDWYFWSHRLPMARAARDAGFAVHVATRVAEHGERIRSEGFTLHKLSWRRRSIGPGATLAAILEIARLYRRERPLLVHHEALKPAVLGSIAAFLAGVPAVINAVTGVGFIAASPSLKARLLRYPVNLVLAHLLERRNSRVIVQNEDDRALLLALHPDAGARIAIIRGSGVDLDQYEPAPEPPAPPVVAAYVGRMLVDKGVPVLVEAQQMLQRRGVDLRLLLAGIPDPENPSSIDEAELERWRRLPGITWLGQVADIAGLWRKAHIAVLPSRREGLPKSLLEAAAMGRPLVASDVPGCREIARADVNALLVPPDDPAALAAALERLAGDPALRRRFGAASRRLVETDLSAAAIGAATVALYRRTLAELGLDRYPGPGSSASVRPSRR